MTKVEQDQRRVCRVRRCALVSGALALGGLSGCVFETAPSSAGGGSGGSGSSSASTIDSRDEAFKIDHDAYGRLGYGLDWRGFPVVSRGQRVNFLDVYEDIVVAQESGATLSILEAGNGALRNSGQLASPLTRFVGNYRHGNHMVCSSDTEAFIVDVETGSVIDRVHLTRVVSTAPVATANQRIYGTAIGHLYSQYMNPPVDAWAYDMGSPIDAEPVLVGTAVVVVSRRGDIAILDAASGMLLARASIYGGCEADPVAGEGAVYFASLDQSIYCFNLGGGQEWRIRTEQPLRITPTYAAGTLYVPSADKGLRALNAATGEAIWNQPAVAGRVIGVRSGRLLTWDGATAAALEPTTGDIVATAQLPEVSMLETDKFEDGNLYAVSKGGIVAKFRPRN